MDYSKFARYAYNRISKLYHKARTDKKTAGWFYNEYLEMPTTLKLIGNVRNKKILDIGCGSGLYARLLSRRGAKVYGIDISEKMIEIAKKEAPGVQFKVGNAETLPYKSNNFDIVLVALMVEHVLNWKKLFSEVRRVLRNKGVFVFSMENPIINSMRKVTYKGKKFREIKNYFKEGTRSETWDFEGLKTKIRSHHKTYSTIIKTIIRAGFKIIDYEDAKPILKSKKIWPIFYKIEVNRPFFCTWKVEKE